MTVTHFGDDESAAGRGPALVLASVWKTYDQVLALRGVNLEVGRGDVCALVGANAAGKTTLLSIAAGLRQADRGSAEVLGLQSGRRCERIRSLVGFAQQELAVYPPLTVRENLVLFAELRGLRRTMRDERIASTAEAFGLSRVLGRRVATLSGGTRRRLHVAIAFLNEPALLLLDEPTAGLDVEGRADLLRAVRAVAEQGAAIVYSTNRLDEAEELDRSVAILDRGAVVAQGRVAELVSAQGETTTQVTSRGLSAVFLALTGRRYDPTHAGSPEGGNVPTA